MPTPNQLNYLYPGSPFLPSITSFHLDHVKRMIKIDRHPQLFSIAWELCEVAINQNKTHFEEHGWISEHFDTNFKDYGDFFIGFTNPCIIIFGTEILNSKNSQLAFQTICHPTEDPDLQKANRYRADLLIPLAEKIEFIPTRDVEKRLRVAFEVLEKAPFSQNKFSLLGFQSAKMTAPKLLSAIENLPK